MVDVNRRWRLLRRANSCHRSDSGQIVVLTTIALVVLLAMAGVAVDLGMLWTQRREMQTAADAAAIAGVLEIKNQGSVRSAAWSDSSQNGFTNGANGVTVTVNNPPATGSYVSDPTAVEVIIQQPEPTYFLPVIGVTSVPVRARAVAHRSAHDCVYVLDKSASNALVVSGSGNLNADCGVVDDSNSSAALVVSGGACVQASSIGVVGGDSVTGCTNPTPKTGITNVPDPLAWVQAPSVGGCSYTNYPHVNSGTSTVLNPGVYCNGITVSGNGVLATLNPGTYILAGGGLTVSGGASLKGDGVAFYNTGNRTYAYKPIVVSGGSSTALSAPSSGSLAGILFFQDRSFTNPAQNTVSGTSGASMQGALYFPTTPLVISGGSSVSPFTMIVADTLTISGPSYASLAPGSSVAAETAALGE